MSQARIYRTKKVQKDWTCGSCGAAIRKGVDGRLSFAVGFRGREQTRCLKPGCSPTRSTLESSATSSIYAAMESIDFSELDSLEEIQEAVQSVADACSEVADEYESNEMYEINYDLQERAETIRSAGDEIDGWNFSGDAEPEHQDFEDEDGEPDEDAFDAAHDEWIQRVRDEAEQVINDIDLP